MSRSILLALALVAGQVMAADVAALSGNWELKIVSPQGTRTPTVVLQQTGHDLTGTYRSQRGDVPVTGTVQGHDFTFTVKLGGADNELTVQYKGKLTGDTIAGKVIMGSRGEAPFTGKRTP